MLRSGVDSTRSAAGHHVITQGGYYQYGARPPGRLPRPAPAHAADDLRRAGARARGAALLGSQQQPRGDGHDPVRRSGRCAAPLDLGTSNDLDFWLLLARGRVRARHARPRLLRRAAVPWADGASATLWDHLKLAVRHQESLARARTAATSSAPPATGRTSRRQFLPDDRVDRSSTAQLAYVYPRLAELADAARRRRVRRAAARRRRRELPASCDASGPAAAGTRAATRGVDQARRRARSTASRSRGRSSPARPTPSRRATLVGNIRRFLTGDRRAPSSAAGADRLLAVAGARRPGRHRDRLGRRPGVGDEQRRLRRRRLVRGQRLADLGARRARRRRARRARASRSTSSSATRSPPTPTAYPDALERDPLGRRRLQLVLLVGARPVRHPAAARLADRRQRPDHPSAGLGPVRGAQLAGDPADRRRATGSRRTLPLKRFSIRLPRVGIEVAGVDARLRPHRVDGDASARSTRRAMPRRGQRGSGSTASRPALSVEHGAITVAAPTGGDRLVDWALRY